MKTILRFYSLAGNMILVLLLLCSTSGAQQVPASTSSEDEVLSPGPITRPMIVEIAPNTYFINEYGMNSMYLIVGQTRALVVDCGSRFCDFKGIIESLTDLPYDVAITHGHVDHAGGMGQFDVVYMHPDDIEQAGNIPHEQLVEYGEIMYNMDIGYKGAWGYSKGDVREFNRMPEIKPLYDGQIFDLGDRRITVYRAPGHSPGSCVFLDPKSRILFSGDAANSNVGTRIAVSTTLRYLLRLQKLRTEYDRIYTGHISYAGTIDVYSMKNQVLDDVIEAFRSVLRGNARLEKIPNHLFPERSQIKAVYGMAQVGFDPEKLWEEGEEHIVP